MIKINTNCSSWQTFATKLVKLSKKARTMRWGVNHISVTQWAGRNHQNGCQCAKCFYHKVEYTGEHRKQSFSYYQYHYGVINTIAFYLQTNLLFTPTELNEIEKNCDSAKITKVINELRKFSSNDIREYINQHYLV